MMSSKLKKMIMGAITLSTLTGLGGTLIANAANNYVPELSVKTKDNHPYIEIGIDMPESDIIYTSDFKTNKPNLRWNGNGTQSFSTLDGKNVLMMTDSINDYKGNYYSYPDTKSQYNYSDFILMKYPANTWFSVSYEVKTVSSNNVISFQAHGGHSGRGYPQVDNSGNKVYWAETVNMQGKRKGASFKVRTQDGSAPNWNDGQTLTLVSSTDTNWGFYYIYFTYNKNTSSLVYDYGPHPSEVFSGSRNPLSYSTFNDEDEVLCLNAGPIHSFFGSRQIPNDGKWHRVSNNSTLKCFDYDSNVNGFKPSFIWKSDNNMYLSNMKFGKASKVQIMRDNKDIIYEDYGSEITDTAITSHPILPSITSADTGAEEVSFKVKAPNTTETHTYKARSLGSDSNTPSSWSKDYSITLGSTVKGYSIVVDKSPNTEPSNTITSLTGDISVKGYKRGDVVYCHAKSVDQKNNWSTTTHYKYVVQQTAPDLVEDIKSTVNNLDNSNDSVNKLNKANMLLLRTNSNIPYTVNSIENRDATKYKRGNVSVSYNVNNNTSESIGKIISPRPIYQTKDEYGSDIINYVAEGNIKEVDYLEYTEAKEKIKEQLILNCKDNPSLNDIQIEIEGGGTEFKEGLAEVKVYYTN